MWDMYREIIGKESTLFVSLFFKKLEVMMRDKINLPTHIGIHPLLDEAISYRLEGFEVRFYQEPIEDEPESGSEGVTGLKKTIYKKPPKLFNKSQKRSMSVKSFKLHRRRYR